MQTYAHDCHPGKKEEAATGYLLSPRVAHTASTTTHRSSAAPMTFKRSRV